MNRPSITSSLGLMLVGTAAIALAPNRPAPPSSRLAGACGSPAVACRPTTSTSGGVPDSLQRAQVLHLLNRITFGPRPGDVDRVLSMGWEQFLDEQLDPDRIPDYRLADRLERFRILRTTASDLAEIEREIRQRRLRAAVPDRAGASRTPSENRPANGEPNRLRALLGEFQQVAVVRATLSERQLYEVMVDFWTNHFNVFLAKGAGRYLTPEYIEHTIRPHALGRFEDLLTATAQSPAMLFYLDNVGSVAEGSNPPQLAQMRRALERQRSRIVAGQGRVRWRPGDRADDPRTPEARIRDAEERLKRLEQRLPSGLNENYARELLELHTVGVDAGYTQRDIVEVARVLTGWSVDRPGRGGTAFVFNAWAHDQGSKQVMGIDFPPGGAMDEGLRLLELLADHPATRRHVSGKLCARFVNDEPPPDCIDAGAAAWERTGGDLREVIRAILTSDAFWSPHNMRTKTKTPLEFVVGAVRALDGDPRDAPILARVIRSLGQPLYLQEPPTGYPEIQEEWVNAGALLNRLNLAIALASQRHPGVLVDLDRLTPAIDDTHSMVAAINDKILNGTAAKTTLDIMVTQAKSAANPREARALLAGLALGSPEFQVQ